MAIDSRIGTKILKNLRTDLAPATNISPFPYIGVVKNNLDPTRCGRVQVFIPELGGNPDEQSNWRTVSYASPFMGYTSTEVNQNDNPNVSESFTGVSHTYGMWMVPPDIGVEVIVIFIAGDPMRGYWVACVNSNLSRHMLPAMAGSKNIDLNTATPGTRESYITGDQLPVVEFNENKPTNSTNPNFYNIPKPVHETQYAILKQQGLHRDSIRGAISSSSQRETPSHVFGISTPGRPTNDPADDPDYLANLNAGTLTEDYYRVKSRKGGHQFVMDDGAVLGTDQLVRLRTAGGHQILMHDTEKTIYIGNSTGDSWVELTKDGSVNVYANKGFNVRSEGTINFHSDIDINFHAGRNINMFAKDKIHLESAETVLLQSTLELDATGTINIKSAGTYNIHAAGNISINSLNSNVGSSLTLDPIEPLQKFSLPDTIFNTVTKTYLSQERQLESITTVAPTHEPFDRNAKPLTKFRGVQPRENYTGLYDAILNVAGISVLNPATLTDYLAQPEPTVTIGNLSKVQFTAYLAQLGKSSSARSTPDTPGNYSYVNTSNWAVGSPRGYIGKYQFSESVLTLQGYIIGDATDPSNWTGKDGITSIETFVANAIVQEKIAQAYTQDNYDALALSGTITADMSPDLVAGMLAVAHLLGADLAKEWRNTGNGVDAYGITGNQWMQIGKYAVSILAVQVTG